MLIRRGPSWLSPALLAVVVAAFAAARLSDVAIPSQREYDEGVYLLSARAMLAGEALFRGVFSSQPPAFLETLAMAMRGAGDSLVTGRYLILGFAVLALLAVAGIARRMFGTWAAPAAAAALALVTTFFDLAHVVQAELPALAVALLSISACLRARAQGWDRRWLAASGSLLALAAMYKLFVAPLALPLLLLLLLAPGEGDATTWRLDGRPGTAIARALRRAVIVAAAVLAVACVPLLFYDHEAIWQQTVAFHVAKYRVFQLDRAVNLGRAGHQLWIDVGIVTTSLAGTALLLRRGRLAAAWLLIWFALMLAVLVQQTPLFWRHFVLLYPPVVLAAAAGAAWLAQRLPWPGALFVMVASACVWAVPAVLDPRPDRANFPWPPVAYELDKRDALELAARWIREHTGPGDLVVGDDPITIYIAGRRAPGALCDTSQARISAGSLTLPEASRHSLAAPLVVLRREGRLTRLRGYMTWLEQHFVQQTGLPGSVGYRRSMWIRKPQPAEKRAS